jgi:hypothetical protein
MGPDYIRIQRKGTEKNQKAKGKRQKAKMKTIFDASFLHF